MWCNHFNVEFMPVCLLIFNIVACLFANVHMSGVYFNFITILLMFH